jgi:hypothetical protein
MLIMPRDPLSKDCLSFPRHVEALALSPRHRNMAFPVVTVAGNGFLKSSIRFLIKGVHLQMAFAPEKLLG